MVPDGGSDATRSGGNQRRIRRDPTAGPDPTVLRGLIRPTASGHKKAAGFWPAAQKVLLEAYDQKVTVKLVKKNRPAWS